MLSIQISDQLAALWWEAKRTIKQAWACSTRKAIRAQQLQYLEFCEHFQLNSLPADLYTLLIYSQFLSTKYRCPDTVQNHLVGVKWLHFFSGLDTTVFGHEALRLMLRGMARIKKHVPKQALPLTISMLESIWKVLDPEEPNDVTFWAALVLSFFLMLRKSNAMPDTSKSFNRKKQLTGSDILKQGDMILVTLRWSKTLQFGGRVHSVPLIRIPGSNLCPLKALTEMSRFFRLQDDQPLFRIQTKTGVLPMNYKWYSNKLKGVVAATGRNPSLFSSHSARRGGATFLSQCGVSKETIMAIGDWSSNAVDKYIKTPFTQTVRAAQIIRQQLKIN